jgi:hypothetical protein
MYCRGSEKNYDWHNNNNNNNNNNKYLKEPRELGVAVRDKGLAAALN